MREIWRVCPSYPLFSASNFGRIRSDARLVRFVSKKGKESLRRKRTKIMVPQKQNGGYLIVALSVDDKIVARTVHSLVADAFLGPRPRGWDVCHADGNRENNKIENLRYDTRSRNFQDMRKHGTYWSRLGGAKITIEEVKTLRSFKGCGISGSAVARIFKLHPEVVNRIWRGETWAHVR